MMGYDAVRCNVCNWFKLKDYLMNSCDMHGIYDAHDWAKGDEILVGDWTLSNK